MRQTDVTDRHCRHRLRTQTRGQVTHHLRHSLIRNIHHEANRLPRLQAEVTRDKTVPIRVDQIARYIFPQGERRMPAQFPIAEAWVVLGRLMRANYPAVVQSVARQKTLGSQHAVRVRIVEALGIPSLARIISLEALHIPITAISQRILFRVERALSSSNLIEAIHLVRSE